MDFGNFLERLSEPGAKVFGNVKVQIGTRTLATPASPFTRELVSGAAAKATVSMLEAKMEQMMAGLQGLQGQIAEGAAERQAQQAELQRQVAALDAARAEGAVERQALQGQIAEGAAERQAQQAELQRQVAEIRQLKREEAKALKRADDFDRQLSEAVQQAESSSATIRRQLQGHVDKSNAVIAELQPKVAMLEPWAKTMCETR